MGYDICLECKANSVPIVVSKIHSSSFQPFFFFFFQLPQQYQALKRHEIVYKGEEEKELYYAFLCHFTLFVHIFSLTFRVPLLHIALILYKRSSEMVESLLEPRIKTMNKD